MPKRKSYPGRNGNQRRYYKARRTTTGRVRTYVPRTMGPFSVSESKYFDSYKQASTILPELSWASTEHDPATLNTLFCPTEGADINNRIGRKVQVYKISMRGNIYSTPSQDDVDVFSSGGFRLILFQDKQTNGVQAQGEELMSSPGASDSQLTFCTFQNPANFGRFKVLKDLILRPRITTASGDGTNTTSQNQSQIPFKITVKFKKPVIVKFNATNGGTVGDIVDNSFHIIAVNSFLSNTNTTIMSYQCRTYYKDN